VAVVGASGGIGQPLSLLLKLDKGVTELSLYDIVHTPGVAADLSHIPTKGKVAGHKGACVCVGRAAMQSDCKAIGRSVNPIDGSNQIKSNQTSALIPSSHPPHPPHPGADSIEAALKGADVIVVPAGVPRKPGMTRDDLFNINASIVKTIAEAAAKVGGPAPPRGLGCLLMLLADADDALLLPPIHPCAGFRWRPRRRTSSSPTPSTPPCPSSRRSSRRPVRACVRAPLPVLEGACMLACIVVISLGAGCPRLLHMSK